MKKGIKDLEKDLGFFAAGVNPVRSLYTNDNKSITHSEKLLNFTSNGVNLFYITDV